MYEVDSFWSCESCGYSNAGLDRCIMCNARGPLMDLTPALTAVPSNGDTAPAEGAEEGREQGTVAADEEPEPLISVAEWRKATYGAGEKSTKAGRRQNRRRATRTVVTIIVLNLVTQFVGGVVAYSSGMEGVTLVKFTLLSGVVFFGMCGLFVLARSAEIGVRPRMSQGGRLVSIAEGIAIGGGEALLMTLLFRALLGRPSVDESFLGLAAEGTLSLVLFGVLVVVILAPLVEELVFRGFMAETFRSRGKWVAVGASALAFALAHLRLFGVPYFFVGGVILGLVYFHRGLLGSISAHAAFNGMLLVFALAVVAGPPVQVELDGSRMTLPGYWHVDDESTGHVAAVGPLGARFEVLREELPGPTNASALAFTFAAPTVPLPGGIVVDPTSVGVTQIPAGEAVRFDADVHGMTGEVVMLPRDTTLWIMTMQTQGSARAAHDFENILWSWTLP